MRFDRWSCAVNGARRRRGAWLAAAAVLFAGCPPAAPEPREPLTALVPEAETGPQTSTAQNAEVAAAKQRLVPYEVEQGGTVYAVRDLLALLPRVGNPRERAEAAFVAAAATLELVLYADLTRDDRPLGGLRDAWGAADRDGLVAAVAARLEELRATVVFATAVENARVVATALRTADHTAGADFARLNTLATSDGPFVFAARVVLLGLHETLVARAAGADATALLEAAETWGAGLPEAGGEVVAGLEERSRAVARLLQFAAANAAAVRAAPTDEPLAALLAGWTAARTLGARPIPFVPPLSAAELPEAGGRLAVVERPGAPLGSRLWVYVTEEQAVVGLRDELWVSAEGVERRPGAFGAAGTSSTACALPAPVPNPRRPSCLQTALAAAAAAGGGTTELAIAAAAGTPLPAVVEVLRAAATAGMRNLRLAARRADGSVAGFAAEFRPDLDPGALEGTVRVAQGGFYVGRRGDLLQITRVAGAHDYAGLARQLATRQVPYVVAPASNTSWTVVLETVAVVGEVAAAGGTTPILAPPPG